MYQDIGYINEEEEALPDDMPDPYEAVHQYQQNRMVITRNSIVDAIIGVETN